MTYLSSDNKILRPWRTEENTKELPEISGLKIRKFARDFFFLLISEFFIEKKHKNVEVENLLEKLDLKKKLIAEIFEQKKQH